MRSLSHELHSSRLELVGLVPALSGLCEEITKSTRLISISRSTMFFPISRKDVGLCLFRVAQEALANVVKHSGASSAQVELGAGPSNLSLRISDMARALTLPRRSMARALD